MIVLGYLLMCLIFGSIFLFIKFGLLLGWSPFLFAGIRFSVAGILLTGIMRLKTGRKLFSSWHWQVQVAGIGLSMTGVPYAAVYWGSQYVSSGMVSLLVATAPLFILLFNRLLYKSKLSMSQLLSVLVCMGGIVLIVLPSLDLKNVENGLLAKLLLVIAEVVFAYGSVRAKELLEKQADPFVFNGLQMFYGGLFLLLLGWVLGDPFTMPATSEGRWMLLYFILVASLFCQSVYYWLIQKTSAFLPSTSNYITPIIAMTVGWMFLREPLIWPGVLGGGLIIASLISMNSKQVGVWWKERRGKKCGSLETRNRA